MSTVNVTLSQHSIDAARTAHTAAPAGAEVAQAYEAASARFSGSAGQAGPVAQGSYVQSGYADGGQAQGPGVTTLAIGEEDGGGYQPVPAPAHGASGGGAGDYMVTTLAIGEEDGGMAMPSPGHSGMAPIYSPGDPVPPQGIVPASTGWSVTSVEMRGEYGKMQPIYSPGEPEYHSFAKASTGPDVLNFTYVERVAVPAPAAPVQASAVTSASTGVDVTVPALESGNFVSVGSYDDYIGAASQPVSAAPVMVSGEAVPAPASVPEPAFAPQEGGNYISIGSLDAVSTAPAPASPAPMEAAPPQYVEPAMAEPEAAAQPAGEYVSIGALDSTEVAPPVPAAAAEIEVPEAEVDLGGSYVTIGSMDAPPQTMEAPVVFEQMPDAPTADPAYAGEPAGYEPPASAAEGAALENAPPMYEVDPVFVDGAKGGDEDLRITTLAIGEEDGGS